MSVEEKIGARMFRLGRVVGGGAGVSRRNLQCNPKK